MNGRRRKAVVIIGTSLAAVAVIAVVIALTAKHGNRGEEKKHSDEVSMEEQSSGEMEEHNRERETGDNVSDFTANRNDKTANTDQDSSQKKTDDINQDNAGDNRTGFNSTDTPKDTKDSGHGSTNAGEKTEPGRKPADDSAASDDPPSSEDESPQDRGWSGYY